MDSMQSPDAAKDTAKDTTTDTARITINTLSGNEVCRFDCVPPNVVALKDLIAQSGHMPVALQKLLREDDCAVCKDDEVLEAKDQRFMLVRDDTPLWYWDLEGNASGAELEVEGPVVKGTNLRTDYSNVVTREPVTAGLHYFEFHLHYYGDEQWCGLTPDKDVAGPEYKKAVPSKSGWYYYSGRNQGAIEALGYTLVKATYAGRKNSVVGMLVDCDNGAAAFDLNGVIQGACEIPKRTPLWVLTHIDTNSDHVELRKPSLEDAPPKNFEALKGALLDVSNGTEMHRSY